MRGSSGHAPGRPATACLPPARATPPSKCGSWGTWARVGTPPDASAMPQQQESTVPPLRSTVTYMSLGMGLREAPAPCLPCDSACECTQSKPDTCWCDISEMMMCAGLPTQPAVKLPALTHPVTAVAFAPPDCGSHSAAESTGRNVLAVGPAEECHSQRLCTDR